MLLINRYEPEWKKIVKVVKNSEEGEENNELKTTKSVLFILNW